MKDLLPTPDTVIRATELAAKYSFAATISAAFILFVPDPAAAQLGLLDLRSHHLGWLWIAFVGSGSLFLSAMAPKATSAISTKLARRAEEKKREKDRQDKLERFRVRLESLNAQELFWVQYCIYSGQRTLFGEAYNPVAMALKAKGLLHPGAGTVWKVPYTFNDEAWQVIQESADTLLPPNIADTADFKRKAQGYEDSLKPHVI